MTKTTYRHLSDRADKYVRTLPQDDPLVRANQLVDAAVAAQDAGDIEYADELLARAEAIL